MDYNILAIIFVATIVGLVIGLLIAHIKNPIKQAKIQKVQSQDKFYGDPNLYGYSGDEEDPYDYPVDYADERIF